MRVQWVEVVALGAAMLWVQPCFAQSAAPSPGSAVSRTATMLHLGATASVQAPPDQLVADLVAQTTSRSAAAAQRQVNALIASGMSEARAVAGVEARADRVFGRPD